MCVIVTRSVSFEVTYLGETSVRQRCHSSPKRKRGTQLERTDLLPRLRLR